MKIHTQNQWAITPLFLLMAAAMSALISWTEYRERLWGLEEEVSSLAVATAAFLENEARALPVETRSSLPDLRRELRPLIERALKASRAFGIEVMEPSTPVATSADPMMSEGGPRMQATVPLTVEGETIAVLKVVTDVTESLAQHDAIVRTLLFACAGITALGVILATVLSGVASSHIRELTAATRAAAEGHYRQIPSQSHVKEISELSNTFNTMTRVLEDFRTKIQLRCLETLAGRSVSYQMLPGTSDASLPHLQHNAGRAALAPAAEEESRAFALLGSQGAPVAWVAVGIANEGGQPARAVRGALSRWLTAQIAAGDIQPVQAFEKAVRYFDLQALAFAFVEKDQVRCLLHGDGISIVQPDKQPEHAVLLHTEPASSDAFLKRTFKTLSASDLLGCLPKLRALMPSRPASGPLALLTLGARAN